MSILFETYFNALKAVPLAEDREHSRRTPLEMLLKSIAQAVNPKIIIIQEPKYLRTNTQKKIAAPDFLAKNPSGTIGYLENKKIGENLNELLKKGKNQQIEKYRELKDNIILTNYLEWIWLKGEEITKVRLAEPEDLENPKFRLDPQNVEKLQNLLERFFAEIPTQINKAHDLADALAKRTRTLKEILLEELENQQVKNEQAELWALYADFKNTVSDQLELREFADAFAQTLSYGLFLAKLNADTREINLRNAKDFIPQSFALIRSLVGYLDILKEKEYNETRWIVEEILAVTNNLDAQALQRKLFYRERKEDDLWDNAKDDPFIYFYEDFLASYDPKLRESKGVYYTPPQVVNFIVRAINEVLQTTFDIPEGLANEQVTVLDFATGTGTFLLQIFQQVFHYQLDKLSTESPKYPLLLKKTVQGHILKNLYGFEYLIAPYTIAHLKLSQFLKDKNYPLAPEERLQVYLTNTLSGTITELEKQFKNAFVREGLLANAVKEKPILVITGNPPYSYKSENTGKWISGIIKDYYVIDGKKLDERNPKGLQDDYVKFIRFAQWKIAQAEEGIVAIITNHSFLDNPTFRGMRQSLMQTFDQLYFLDLHGNSKRKERTPIGGKDENIFDIQQGVAISVMIKKKGLPKQVFHADYYGLRKEKYQNALKDSLKTVDWEILQPNSPFYLFKPQNQELREVYEKSISLDKIFKTHIYGFKTHRDNFSIAFSKDEIQQRIIDLKNASNNFLEKYDLKNFDWKNASKKLQIKQNLFDEISLCAYRPFDNRYTFYSEIVIDRIRPQLKNNVFSKKNLCLIVSRQVSSQNYYHSYITNLVANDCLISNLTKEANHIFYLYNYESNTNLFPNEEEITKEVNFTLEFKDFLKSRKLNIYTPEQILGYIYAILHSKTYREKYAEFLKIDFPNIPFSEDLETFEILSELGWELIQTHLQNEIPNFQIGEPKYKKDIEASLLIEKVVYDDNKQVLWVNKSLYFEKISPEIYNFMIGGYQVLPKYLKDRTGRELNFEEIQNVENIVNILGFTIEQMQKIENYTKNWI